jgi:serine/threonine-protein kinase RsbW
MSEVESAGADEQTGEIVLEIPARTDYVSFVRVVVAAAAELEPHMDAERIDDLRVAVSEATTNAIDAHVSHDSTDRIRVQCNLAEDQVAVVIHDEGVGFEPDDLPELPPPESPERLLHESGLGVPLMRMLADEAEIVSHEGGTRIRLVVYSSRRRRRRRRRS